MVPRGACVVAGGMHGPKQGACVNCGGACMVAGGHVWLNRGMLVAGNVCGCGGDVRGIRRDTVNEWVKRSRILLVSFFVGSAFALG